MNLFKYAWKTLKYSFWNILLFEIMYRLFTIIIVIPFLSVVLKNLIQQSGYTYAANENLLYFFLTEYGILASVLLMIFSVLIIFYEFAVLILLIYYAGKEQKVHLRFVLRKALSPLQALFTFSLPVFALYLLLLRPLMKLGVSSTLLPTLAIPNFITGELFKMEYGVYLYIGVLLLVFCINIRWMFALPIIVLEEKSFWRAAKKSGEIVKKNLGRIVIVALFTIAGLFLLFLSVDGVSELLYRLSTSTSNSYLAALGAIAYTHLIYIFAIFLTPLMLSIMTWFYIRKAGEEEIRVMDDPHVCPDKHPTFVKRHKYKLLISYMAIVSVVIIAVVNFLYVFPAFEHKPITMAHRGATEKGVENTLEAIQGAIDAHADYAEIDILQTKDKQLVVIHDINLSRLAGINKHVYEMTLAELREVTLQQGRYSGKISTLDEVIKFAKNKIKLNIEVKLHGYEQEKDVITSLLRILKENKFETECVIQSLHDTVVYNVKRTNPNLQVGFVLFANRTGLKDLPGDFFVMEEYMLNKSVLKEAKSLNKAVYVWTANSYESIYTFLKMGVDGVITDYPEYVHEAIWQITQEHKQYGPFRVATETMESMFEKFIRIE
ncbi:glycerophosphodiester phosphodiesterase [Brevibacillus laterosporus]|uniref:glycerophosphoryl diester phosphodiesterase membrane domain-containing protein n=1 Tax=Brevibacillus laterosporus TaxID=1465 RepID=UPI0003643950|nr:glycerophosphodiester phosphodiesterase [Brevibacillus laterosporus]ATO50586.1 glycerophosphodiester phosphodiesterase [Brevibacillus laterosporus DSM 25]MBG9800313.1 glycerophosphodiester phosphodiesterase [Brevibacillus laterosporus]MCR8938000.1 glycerophosphodiester phosphodiesterase [Brevibacillus laterosporus]MCZ0840640.1 glycerophosphodiester phosphodiesterase [Brevibacillus laterosporus]MCZ0844582.1 glycerophosphodiester phosphodiesterase [Brevibacillus laterosporus]